MGEYDYEESVFFSTSELPCSYMLLDQTKMFFPFIF